MKTETSRKITILLALVALIFACGIGYLGYQNYQLTQTKLSLETELTNTKQDFASTTQKLASDIEAFRELLIATQSDKVSAEQDIRKQKEVLDAISSTLGTYEKLANTDRELLAKYSRVYFLNENYTPKYSITIPAPYTYEPEKEKMIMAEVWPFLQKLLDDAKTANIDLKIISAYRSFDTQGKLKSAYTVTYGIGSNKFSADQGYSEHQLGTTIDFTTSKLAASFYTFEKTASYSWLMENAYKYGFILSYPKKNGYYIFEPWHWRFVGKSLALRLHDGNKNFYDIPQREINEYLISIFETEPKVQIAPLSSSTR
ncbi:MAG: M15 family metallopeptidase [Candidatus Yonathbacteria bacterium]|nr:M15 family metallopeptidase [Candidatus Yonathbacteria bacterium]